MSWCYCHTEWNIMDSSMRVLFYLKKLELVKKKENKSFLFSGQKYLQYEIFGREHSLYSEVLLWCLFKSWHLLIYLQSSLWMSGWLLLYVSWCTFLCCHMIWTSSLNAAQEIQYKWRAPRRRSCRKITKKH